MSGLPHALIQLSSSTVMLKCMKLWVTSKAPYVEGISIKPLCTLKIAHWMFCTMRLEKRDPYCGRKCIIPMALILVTLGPMVHC